MARPHVGKRVCERHRESQMESRLKACRSKKPKRRSTFHDQLTSKPSCKPRSRRFAKPGRIKNRRSGCVHSLSGLCFVTVTVFDSNDPAACTGVCDSFALCCADACVAALYLICVTFMSADQSFRTGLQFSLNPGHFWAAART